MSTETVIKASTTNPKKRKLIEDPGGVDHKPKSPKRETHDGDIAGRDPALLSDTFARVVAETRDKNLTTIELSEFTIPSSAFHDTSGFTRPRIAASLPAFLVQYVSGGKEELSRCKDKASPHTMIVAMSGMRVADLYREVVVYNNSKSRVAKFIAKHMKLKDNIEYLEDTNVGVVISTPQRFADLVEQGALKSECLKRIVVDVSHEDEKKRTILNLNAVSSALLRLLNVSAIKDRYGSASTDPVVIMVF